MALFQEPQHNKRQRVAAYCRVSTDSAEQINSYEVQMEKYTDMINSNPDWELVKIYADKGISGTSTKHREEFNKMIRACKRGKIDMIITKSVSRFARNNLDCLKYTRELRQLGVDVFFEEQGLHSIAPTSEFYISLYGTLAQSESENMSENIKWGKQQAVKEGKVTFAYSSMLGYRKGADDNPEIVPEEAETVRLIFKEFLKGKTYTGIAKLLTDRGIPSPTGKNTWYANTIKSILTNVKYKGDIISNKTYVEDCISKKKRTNKGERQQYYIRNNHPAIVTDEVYDAVQLEISKRESRPIARKLNAITELGRYQGKHALSDIMVCGKCGAPYARKTYMRKGIQLKVWRCTTRLDDHKACSSSPTLKESDLQRAILEVIKDNSDEVTEMINIMKSQLEAVIGVRTIGYRGIELQERIAKLQSACKAMLSTIKFDDTSGESDFDDELFEKMMAEKYQLEEELQQLILEDKTSTVNKDRINEIVEIIDALKNHPLEWDDEGVRQIIDKVVIENESLLRVFFVGGLEVDKEL